MTLPLNRFRARGASALLHPCMRQSGALIVERGESVRLQIAAVLATQTRARAEGHLA